MTFFRGSETVVIKRRSAAATDEWGNKTHTTTNITVTNCMLGFGSDSEAVEPNREPVDRTVTLYMPNGTQIQAGDRFIVRSTEFILDGLPQDWQAPFNFDVGVVVRLKRKSG
jgi:hypothetical protein